MDRRRRREEDAAHRGQVRDYTNFDAHARTRSSTSRRSSSSTARTSARDFGAIVRSGNYNVVIGETEADVKDKLAWIVAHYEPRVPAHELERYKTMYESGPLVGTPELIVERLRAAEAMGMTYAIGNFVDAAYDPTSQELFTTKVIPEFR